MPDKQGLFRFGGEKTFRFLDQFPKRNIQSISDGFGGI